MARKYSKRAKERMAGNRLQNEVQLMLDRGELAPEEAMFMKEIAEKARIEQAGGDYFEPVYGRNAGKKDKFFMVPTERAHGLSQSPATYRALIAAEEMYRTGDKSNIRSMGDDSELRELLNKHVMPTSIKSIGGLGSRTAPTEEEALGRLAALLGDTDRGYNRKTGMPFSGVGLDAGHIASHASNPELSNAASNIMFENQYMNKAKASAEKVAYQQGRQATDEELADALFRSFINKITSDVKLPSRNTKEGKAAYKALMDPINAKLAGLT